MARYLKVHDPAETKRQIHIVVTEAHAPGVLEFLSSLPHGCEAGLIRGLLTQFVERCSALEERQLNQAVQDVLDGPGGIATPGRVSTKPKTTKRKAVTVQKKATQNVREEVGASPMPAQTAEHQPALHQASRLEAPVIGPEPTTNSVSEPSAQLSEADADDLDKLDKMFGD